MKFRGGLAFKWSFDIKPPVNYLCILLFLLFKNILCVMSLHKFKINKQIWFNDIFSLTYIFWDSFLVYCLMQGSWVWTRKLFGHKLCPLYINYILSSHNNSAKSFFAKKIFNSKKKNVWLYVIIESALVPILPRLEKIQLKSINWNKYWVCDLTLICNVTWAN